jgi:hypothetical protein
MNTVIQLRASQSVKPTVGGGRAKNADYRQREYLTEPEVEKLLATAGESRNPGRDRAGYALAAHGVDTRTLQAFMAIARLPTPSSTPR